MRAWQGTSSVTRAKLINTSDKPDKISEALRAVTLHNVSQYYSGVARWGSGGTFWGAALC